MDDTRAEDAADAGRGRDAVPRRPEDVTRWALPAASAASARRGHRRFRESEVRALLEAAADAARSRAAAAGPHRSALEHYPARAKGDVVLYGWCAASSSSACRLLRARHHHHARERGAQPAQDGLAGARRCSPRSWAASPGWSAGRPQGPARSLPYKGNPRRSRRSTTGPAAPPRTRPTTTRRSCAPCASAPRSSARKAEQERRRRGPLTGGDRPTRADLEGARIVAALASSAGAVACSVVYALPRARRVRCCPSRCGSRRAAAVSDRRPGSSPAARPGRRGRARRSRAAHPDDDEDFLRELRQRARSSAAGRSATTRRERVTGPAGLRRSGVGVQADHEDVDDVVVDRPARRPRRRRPRRPWCPSSRRSRGRAGSRRRAPR